MTYFLHSARLGFRPWRPEDVELAVALWADPEVGRFIGGPFSAGEAMERLQGEIETASRAGVQYWPLFLRANGEHAGCCGLRPHSRRSDWLELGFQIRREHWGRGLATEAGRAVVDFAFAELRVEALFAGHHPDNVASRRVLEKLGFRYTHEELYEPTGMRHPSYLLRRAEGG